MKVSETVDDSTNDASRPTLLEELKQKMTDKIFRMLLTLRAKKNVPYTISVQMIAFLEQFTTIFDEVTSALHSTAAPIVNVDRISPALETIIDSLEKSKDAFDDFKTEYKIQKLYAKYPMFVAVLIGKRVENSVGPDGVVHAEVKYNEAQHISVQSTIAMKFQNQRFREYWKKEVSKFERTVHLCGTETPPTKIIKN